MEEAELEAARIRKELVDHLDDAPLAEFLEAKGLLLTVGPILVKERLHTIILRLCTVDELVMGGMAEEIARRLLTEHLSLPRAAAVEVQ